MQEMPATEATSDNDVGHDAAADRQGAEPIQTAASHSEVSFGVLLAGALGFVIAGIFVRRIVKTTFARRRAFYTDRREPDRPASVASESTLPGFTALQRDLAAGSIENDRLDDEVREALRKLLRVLDRQAV